MYWPAGDTIEDGREVVETECKEDFGGERLELHHQMIGLVWRVEELMTEQQPRQQLQWTGDTVQ